MLHRPEVGLQHVLSSGAAALGAPGFDNRMGLDECSVAVVCLIDGLGAQSIEENLDLFDSLADAEGGSIEAAFPTTTPTGLATLGTGRPPGEHGIVGASFYLPEDDVILSPLHWGRLPSPLAVQPEPTVFERVAALGMQAITIAPAAYARSGLTAAVLRGSEYQAAESVDERKSRLQEVVGSDRPALVYVYWAALDRAAHEFGLRSQQWRDAAREVNSLLWELRGALPVSGMLTVTADHGMVDCVERVWIEDFALLQVGIRAVAGEPRMRHIYAQADHDPADIARRWREVLVDKATVLLRREAIDAGLFGSMESATIDRIGDVLAIAEGGVVLASRTFDERVSLLRGHHGALTDAERRIPGLVVRP